MKCPNCNQEMHTTHAYAAGDISVSRLACEGCNTVVTAQTMVQAINVNPGRGQGAYALAKKLRENAAGSSTAHANHPRA